MPGSNAGTGQPLYFQCGKCRLRGGGYWRLDTSYARWIRKMGKADRITLTGRTRAAPHGNAFGRSTTRRREYKCLDCGHVGWSRHSDLERMEKHESNDQVRPEARVVD